MTQGPPERWPGTDRDDEMRGRDSHRLAILVRASSAVRRAQALVEEAAEARAAVEETFRAALENRARRYGERDARDVPAARDQLEVLVRRFAVRLRAEGEPPEIAVRRVKSAVEPAIFSARDHDGSDVNRRRDVDWRRSVASDVVKWFVQAYYAA